MNQEAIAAAVVHEMAAHVAVAVVDDGDVAAAVAAAAAAAADDAADGPGVVMDDVGAAIGAADAVDAVDAADAVGGAWGRVVEVASRVLIASMASAAVAAHTEDSEAHGNMTGFPENDAVAGVGGLSGGTADWVGNAHC